MKPTSHGLDGGSRLISVFDRHAMSRRVRPTFLLHGAITLFCLAVLIGMVAWLGSGPVSLVALVGLALFVLLGIELELLPTLLEWYVVRWARKRPGPHGSVWFVDLDAEERRARNQQRADVEQNPTLW